MVLIDGKEGPAGGPYDRGRDFIINASGTGWSFTAVPDSRDPETVRKVVNGQELGPFGWADKTWFSQDGKGFYFWARIPGKDGGSLLTFNGKTYGPFQFDFSNRVFDLEAGTFALQRRTSSGVSLRVKDGELGPFQDVNILKAGRTVRGRKRPVLRLCRFSQGRPQRDPRPG